MRCVNSYQDIKTPEEEQENWEKEMVLQKEIEEQAEHQACAHIGISSYKRNPDAHSLFKTGFRVGAKWGIEHAIEWHDLRENPNDLPEDGTEVMFITKNERETLTGTYKNGGGEGTPIFDTFGIAFYDNEQVIAWCELPQFKE